jgi:hypothetical protein
MTSRFMGRLDRIEQQLSPRRVIVYSAADSASEVEHERLLNIAAGEAGIGPNDLVVCLRQFFCDDEPPKDEGEQVEHCGGNAEHVKAIDRALKPKTLDEMLAEYDLEMAED